MCEHMQAASIENVRLRKNTDKSCEHTGCRDKVRHWKQKEERENDSQVWEEKQNDK